ncbi:MAG: hypothetical protein U0T83_11290 [Bacteriovoracaceae bacterium]
MVFTFQKYFIFIAVLFILSSCIGKNTVAIKSKSAKATTSSSSITVSSVKILNNQFVLTGTNLNSATSIVIKENGTTTTLTIESQSSSSLIANSLASVTLAAGKVLEFVVSSASASATFTVDFSLCSSTLVGKYFDCTTTPNDKEVLAYDATSGKWKPRAVNGLSYQGVWDASSSLPTTTEAGDYYIVSVASGSYAVGDWIVYNGTSFEQISNSNSVISVFGRTGAVTATEADYVLGKMGDVDFTSATPTTNQYLKFNGTNWVPGTISTTESDPNVMTFAKTTLPTCGSGEVLKGNGTSLSCVTDNSGAGSFSGTASRAMVTDGSGALAVSAVTSTELGYVSGVTSAIQTQITNVAATAAALTSNSLASSMTSGNIFVGNGSNVATSVTLSGDATIANTGALTIAANSVALTTDTTGNYVTNITASNGLQATAAAGEGTTPNVVLGGTLTDDTTINATNTKTFKVQDLVGTDFLTFTGATGITLVTKLAATTADIDAGTLDNVAIGATTRNSAAVTTLAATAAYIATASIDNALITTADINGGTLDNVTIGTTTRAAGSFTTINGTSAAIAGTVSAGTLLTSNILGGTTTTSGLTLQTTSGAGTTTADMHFLVGNNGGTEAMTILNNGNVGIGIATPNSTLQVAGSVATKLLSKTANYTLTSSDSVILGDASGGTITLTLPTAVGIEGRQYTLKKTDSSTNAVTVSTTAAQTIDGATSFSLANRYDNLTIVSDGANWSIISSTAPEVQTRWDTHAGNGSTNTHIPYFTNTNYSVGSAGNYTIDNSAVNGLSITIDKAGFYAVSVWFLPASPTYAGISLNSNQLTTAISTITPANRLAISTSSAADYIAFSSWTGWLAVGDVIRPHTTGFGTGNAPGMAGMSIAKIR